MLPIDEVARQLGLEAAELVRYGDDRAKVRLSSLEKAPSAAGRLVLVSAITPTGGGEGKTTVAIGLAMAMRRLGRNAVVALREPSLGPVFGAKGGGTGGGKAQVVPADDINLHFTGDLHAVTSAHNLLAALVDHDLHLGAPSGLEARRVTWPRVLDVEDRAVRHIVVGLGGQSNGVPRETRFEITAASEVMAVLSLAQSQADLRERLGRIVVGERADGSEVTADQLGAADAMQVLLKDALLPNLVQTVEGGAALVHGGPFANIAHGCSSVLATHLGLGTADEVITEAGFGFDLGGEKFLDIACRVAGVWPRCVVLVVTAQGLDVHGGGQGRAPIDADSVGRGLAHLDRQVMNVRAFGLEPIVALNVIADVPEAINAPIEEHCARAGLTVARSTAFADGGAGALELAALVLKALNATDAAPPEPRYLYDLGASYADKLNIVSRRLYGAREVTFARSAERALAELEDGGHPDLPVCISKTPSSLSTRPDAVGVPAPFEAHVTQIRLAAGAGFVVALMGDIETMPGLPRDPAARRIRVDANGDVTGLMQGER